MSIVKLKQVSYPRTIIIGNSYESAFSLERFPDLAADFDRRVIIISGHLVPFECGGVMLLAPASEECPECKEKFANGQALGAHRWRSHQVKGGRSAEE